MVWCVKYLLIVLFASLLVSCSSTVPSISGFMNPKSEIYAKGTLKFGDLRIEDKSSLDREDAYDQEANADLVIGGYLNDKIIGMGMEIGPAGLKPSLGLKNRYVGILGWTNLDILWRTEVSFGAAFAQQLFFGNASTPLRAGLFEYVNKTTVARLDHRLITEYVGYSSYVETGLGIYGAIEFAKYLGMTCEYKLGRQISTHELRHYVDMNFVVNFR